MVIHLILQVIDMRYGNALSTPMITTLNTRDSRRASRLVQRIQTLNSEIRQLLQGQPTFFSCVQDAFNQAFNTLPTPLDLTRTYLKITPADAPPTGPAQALNPLLPTLMEAAVERLVTQHSAHYAQHATRFHLTCDGRDDGSALALTPQAFDGFLDTLASTLAARFNTHVEQFWGAPIDTYDTRTCKQWLAEKRLDLMRAEAELLKIDGLLEVSSELLLLRVMRYPDAASRRALNGYRPCALGVVVKDKLSRDIPLYGAFVLTARDPDDAQVRFEGEEKPLQVRDIAPQANVGNVLLYLPTSGFEAFDSLTGLDRELHRRLNSAIEFGDILALMSHNDRASGLAFHQQQPQGDQFRYLERLESVFSDSLHALHERAQADFTWMIAHYQRQPHGLDPRQLPAGLDRVTDLSRAFDASGVLVARHQKKLRRQLQQFLKHASPDDQQRWSSTTQAYADALQQLSVPEGLPSLSQFSDPAAVLSYSNQQLRTRLEDEYGLVTDPDTLIIHTKTYAARPIGSYVVGGKPQPPATGTPVYTTRTLTLTALALENIEWLDLNFTNFAWLTDKDKAPYTALTVAQVKELVRKVNIGDSYEQFLKTRLVSSSEAHADQDRYAQLMALQLRVDAIEAKIAGDFLPDRLDRGYNWVMSALAGPTDDDKRPTVEEHRIIVSSLKLRGERVRGVLVFSTASHSVTSLVVYTPGTANGRLFHEYPDASAMHRDFINHSAWRDYLTARVELSARPRILNLLKGGANEAVIALSRIAGHFLEEAYQAEASAVINDANAQSTSTQEANLESAATLVTAALDFATLFLPVKVMLPIGLSRSILSIINAVEAAQLGDRTAAAQYIVRALGEMVGAVIDGAIGGARSASRGIATGAKLNPKLALRNKPTGVKPLAGWEDQQIYVQDTATPGAFEAPRHFLQESGRWYSIRRDHDRQVWRLKDPRRAPSAYPGEPLYRTVQGAWEIRSPLIGLFGGSPPTGPETALMDLFPHLDLQQARRVFESFNFPAFNNLEHQMSLVFRLSRAPDQLDVSFAYLQTTQNRFWARLQGADLPSAQTVTAIDPAPGPSRPALPPRRPARSDAERFVDWGQAFAPQTMNPVPGRPGVWRRSQALQDYIKINGRYYAILPGDSVFATQGARTAIVSADLPHSTFAQFEHVVANAPLEQPRLVEYNAHLDTWLIHPQPPLPSSIATHMNRMFPRFDPLARAQLGASLFNTANPPGLTAKGFAHVLNTLQDWTEWTRGAAGTLTQRHALIANDPLALLPTLPRGPGPFEWSLGVSNGFNLIRFDTAGVRPTLVSNLLERPTQINIKTLMRELLTDSHYEVYDSRYSTELIFRRADRPTWYWLTLRKTHSPKLSAKQYNPQTPTPANLEGQRPTLRDALIQARDAGNLLLLIGGVELTGTWGVKPFIFRP